MQAPSAVRHISFPSFTSKLFITHLLMYCFLGFYYHRSLHQLVRDQLLFFCFPLFLPSYVVLPFDAFRISSSICSFLLFFFFLLVASCLCSLCICICSSSFYRRTFTNPIVHLAIHRSWWHRQHPPLTKCLAQPGHIHLPFQARRSSPHGELLVYPFSFLVPCFFASLSSFCFHRA